MDFSKHRLNVCIVLFSVLVAIAYGAIHFMCVSVSELTKDTFEPFSLDARIMPIELQHRLVFSLLGLVLALSGGLLAKDYLHAREVAGKILITCGDLRLWVVFLASAVISCSVFYHAFKFW